MELPPLRIGKGNVPPPPPKRKIPPPPPRSIHDSTPKTRKGVKGNDGKAVRSNAWKQFAIILMVAVLLVEGKRTFWSSAWDSEPVPNEKKVVDGNTIHNSMRSDSIKKNTDSAKSDGSNTKMEAGKTQMQHMKTMDEASQEEKLLPANKEPNWDGDNTESNFIQFEFSNLDGEEGSTGIVVVELHPEWAPLGVERIKELTEASFWEGCRFFRVVPNFMSQIGINGDPEVAKHWRSRNIKDDPVVQTNERGTVSFAMAGKGTRTSQIFFNTGRKNAYLDKEGFAPFGRVVTGMDVVDRIYDGYREKPNQGAIQQNGNKYLQAHFPKLTYISRARLTKSDAL